MKNVCLVLIVLWNTPHAFITKRPNLSVLGWNHLCMLCTYRDILSLSLTQKHKCFWKRGRLIVCYYRPLECPRQKKTILIRFFVRSWLMRLLTLNVGPTLFQCWANVFDADPTLRQCWATFLCGYWCSCCVRCSVTVRQEDMTYSDTDDDRHCHWHWHNSLTWSWWWSGVYICKNHAIWERGYWATPPPLFQWQDSLCI